MSIINKSIELANALALTATAISDVIDLTSSPVIKDIGNGRQLYGVFFVNATLASAGATTLELSIESDGVAGLGASPTVHARTSPIPKSALVAGYTKLIPLPAEFAHERFLGLRATVATGPFTSGSYSFFITPNIQLWSSAQDQLPTSPQGFDGFTGTNSRTVDWQSRVAADGGTYSGAELAAVNQAYNDIDNNALGGKIKRMNLSVGDAICQRVCMFSSWGTVNLDTIQGSPTINSRGITIDGTTKYIRTGITPFSQSGFNGQDCHMSCWTTEGNDTVANRAIMGCYSDSGTKRWGMQWNTTGIIFGYHGVTGENTTRNARTLGILSGHQLINSLPAVGTSMWQNGENVMGAGVYGTNPTAATSAGWPNAELIVGNATNAALSGAGVYAGYHLGTGLTAAEILVMHEIMAKATQSIGRQETWHAAGDSLTSSSAWATTIQSATLPRRTFGTTAVGGIGSATLLTNVQAAIAANPGIKYRNWIIWIGQNDSGVGGWDGANTVANVAAIRALLPHASFRILKMIPKNAVDEYTGGAKRLIKDSVSSQWTTLYGAKAVDIVTPLIAGGLGSGQDLVDSTNGVIPSSLKKNSALAMSAATQANPCVITTASHTGIAVVGDVVQIAGVVGMTELNGQSAYVTLPSSTTISLTGVNSAAYTAYGSGGTATVIDAIHINSAGDTIVANTIAATLPASGSWI